MTTLSKDNLTINGSGASAGGTFNKVTLNGSGKIQSDIICNKFECNGTGTVNGDLRAQTIRINGIGKLNGAVYSTESLQIDGKGQIEKDVTIKTMTVNGLATIGGPIKGQTLEINGKATVQKDCEVEFFKAQGIFKIYGLLNAEQIDVQVHGNCQVDEMGGQEIRVKVRRHRFFKFLEKFWPAQLQTRLIEGTTIDLEATHAKVVRGEHVVIGADCEIDLVEYTGSLKTSPDAKIGEAKHVGGDQ